MSKLVKAVYLWDKDGFEVVTENEYPLIGKLPVGAYFQSRTRRWFTFILDKVLNVSVKDREVLAALKKKYAIEHPCGFFVLYL